MADKQFNYKIKKRIPEFVSEESKEQEKNISYDDFLSVYLTENEQYFLDIFSDFCEEFNIDENKDIDLNAFCNFMLCYADFQFSNLNLNADINIVISSSLIALQEKVKFLTQTYDQINEHNNKIGDGK